MIKKHNKQLYFTSFNMNNHILKHQVLEGYLKLNIPTFRLGDIVCVYTRLREENKQRIQTFTGTLIAYSRSGRNSTITIRRIYRTVRIEQTFFLHSRSIQSFVIIRRSIVRREKLYYLRYSKGRSSYLRECFMKVSPCSTILSIKKTTYSGSNRVTHYALLLAELYTRC
jgi:large subunit ribosomal protein L19